MCEGQKKTVWRQRMVIIIWLLEDDVDGHWVNSVNGNQSNVSLVLSNQRTMEMRTMR